MASSTTKRRIEDTESDRDRRKQRKWSKAEETAIADYIKENYNRYKVNSKTSFARKMRDDLYLDCDDGNIKQLVNKMQVMEAKYKLVNSECGKTGEGLTEGTMEFKSWEGYVNEKCHYFFILDAVMKTRANITPPFEINFADSQESLECDPAADEEAQDRILERRLFSLEDTEDSPPPGPERKKSKSIEKMKVMHKLEKGSSSAIADALKMQAEASSKHYERLDAQQKLDAEINAKKVDIEQKRLDLDSKRQDRLLELEEKKQSQHFELESMRMNRESEKEKNEIMKLSLQLELEKLRRT